MRRVQVDYVVDGTVCRDVVHAADGRTNVTVHPDGRGSVKLTGQTLLYARVVRIRVADVDQAGPELDMA